MKMPLPVAERAGIEYHHSMTDSMSSPLPEIASYLRRDKHARKVEVPKIGDLPTELREAAQRLPLLTGTWNPVEIYTAEPKTLQEEKQTFLEAYRRGRAYQPRLTYDMADTFDLGDARAVLETMLATVRACKTTERGMKLVKLMLHHKIRDDLATYDLVDGIQRKDEALIGNALQYKYPGVDPLILALAERDFRHRTDHASDEEKTDPGLLTPEQKTYLRELQFDAEGVREAFEWALEQYGILRTDAGGSGYRVEVDPRATAIDVRDKSVRGPTVFVPERTRESGERLLGLIAHEIEGHARQSWNGERLFMFGGGPLKIDEETLYEGLAMRYENEFRSTWFGTEYESRNLDYYVFAVRAAETGSTFHEVFCDQVEKRLRVLLRIPEHTSFDPARVRGTPEEDHALRAAWGTTYRTMRGHTDMANPERFAMAKDLAYFRGYMLDRQLRESGHGHINEAAICSIGQLRMLAEFQIREDHLPISFQNVTERRLKMMLARMPA